MLSYGNDVQRKRFYLKRARRHRDADRIIQGRGWEKNPDSSEYRGCLIGCTMESYSHQKFARQIAPKWLAHLADSIFEGIPADEAPDFVVDFLESIPVGVDLTPVRDRIGVARMGRLLDSLPETDEWGVRDAVEGVQQSIITNRGRNSAALSAERAASAALSAALSAEPAALSAAWQAERDALLMELRRIGREARKND